MALRNHNLSQTNREKIDNLFNNLQVELDKQKASLLDQFNDQQDIIINQQKYNNIINNLKNIATAPSVTYSTSLLNEGHDQTNFESYTTDQLSIWIKNKQLWQYIDKNNVQSIQHDIISDVFGRFQGLMEHLLGEISTLNTLKQNKLYNRSLNHSSYSHDIFHNYHCKESKVTIASIPDQCLSYIMKFLTQNNRYLVQRTCRLFALAIRQECAVNNIEKICNYDMIPNRNL